MNVLFSLPTDVFHSVLVEWLLFNEFCALDTAVCCVSMRHVFLDSVNPSFPNVVFDASKIESQFVGNFNALNYLWRRNLAVKSLTLTNLMCYLFEERRAWNGLSKLQYLVFKGCGSGSAYVLSQFSSVCARLQKLTLTNSAYITNAIVLSFIAKNCSTLTSISLCSCLILRDEVLLEIARSCSLLEELFLDNCPKLTDEGLLDLVNSAEGRSLSRSLKVLHLSNNRQLECDTLLKVFLWCVELCEIAVAGCYDIGDEFVDSICKHHTHLHSLNLSSTDITDHSLMSIAQHCPTMRSLNVSYCNDFRDQVLLMLAQSLPLLEALHCQSCDLNSEALGAFAQFCTHITVLDATNNYLESAAMETISGLRLTTLNMTTDETLETGLQFLAQQCSTLTSIDFSFNSELSDESLIPLLTANVGLTAVNCSNCPLLTGLVISALAASCPQLRELNVNQCEISDEGFKDLAGQCPLLEILAVSKCQLTDASLVPLFRTHKRLTHVDLTNVDITDATLEALAGNKRLLKCSLYGCSRVTNAGLAVMCTHLKGMVELDITNCPLITDEGINLIEVGGFPQLELLYCFVQSRFNSERTSGALEDLMTVKPDLMIINDGAEYDEDAVELDGVDDMLEDDGFEDFDGEDESIEDEGFFSEEEEGLYTEEDLTAAGNDSNLVIVATESSDEMEDESSN